METLEIILITITAALLFILFTSLDFIWNKRALNVYREIVWRGLFPLIVCCIYMLPFIFLSFNPFIFLIFIYVLFNIALAATVWATEGFFIGTLKLKSAGSYYYHLNFYSGEKRNGEANFFKFEDQSTTLESLVKIIDFLKLMDRKKEPSESEEKWQKHLQMKKNYEVWKKEADKYNVTVLGFLDITQIWFGFKKLIYIHQEPLDNINAINANCAALPDKSKIEHRNFETIIGWAGLPETEISQRLEVSKMIFDFFISLPLLEQIPIKDAMISKLKAINREQKQALETHKSLDATAARAIYGTNPPPPKKSDEMKRFFFLILIALIVFAALIITFIILMALGVF